MKKNFFIPMAALIPLTLFLSAGFAQNQSAETVFNDKMKVTPPDSVVNQPKSLNYSTDIGSLSTKIAKNFTRNFKDVDDVRINLIKNYTYIYCKKDGITNRIRYDKKGNWDYTIRYYQEDQMPKEIRKQVKINFFDFEIDGVSEVSVGNKTAYLVTIKSIQTWKTVKILDDEMSVVGSYQAK